MTYKLLYLNNCNNAPIVVRDALGKTIWTWDNREPFGLQRPNEDPDGDMQYFYLNLRFPGQWFDNETGLFHNGFRDYNPSLGRYMQSDPLGLEAGFNTYSYVNGNPYRSVDPYGLISRGFKQYSLQEAKKADEKGNSFTIMLKGIETKYDVGSILTDKGNSVTVYQWKSGYQGGKQNCHGYALQLPFWINDPTTIYNDEYDEVDYSIATHTFFRHRLKGTAAHSGLIYHYNNGVNDMSFGKWGVNSTRANSQIDLEFIYSSAHYRKK